MYESHGVFLSSSMAEHPAKEDGGSSPPFDNSKIIYRGRLHKSAFLFLLITLLFSNKNQMTATLVRANCKLIFLCNSDSVPPVALLAKNLLIHLFIVLL